MAYRPTFLIMTASDASNKKLKLLQSRQEHNIILSRVSRKPAKPTSGTIRENNVHRKRSRYTTTFVTPNQQLIMFNYTAMNIPKTPEKEGPVQLELI